MRRWNLRCSRLESALPQTLHRKCRSSECARKWRRSELRCANDREHTAQRSASARPAASGCARERCASRYLSCTKHSLSGALLLADNGFKATPYELRCANDREHTAQRSASARPAASGCARERCASRYLSCTKHSLSGASLLADNGFKATPYELRCANDREHTAQRSASARPAASGCARERCASRYLSCTKHSLSGASLLADNGFKATPYELRCANDREHTAQRSASARPAASGCARERCASRYLSCTKHSLSGALLLADNGFKPTPYELRCANDREHTAQRSASARPAASGCARERCASRYLSCTKHSLSGALLLADNGFKATPYELRCANDREHTAQRSASARPAASGCARERCASRYLSCTKHSLSGASLLADNGFKATPYELRCANDREHTAQRSASARPAASGCARERCASRYLSCTKHSLSGALLLADNGFKPTPYELRCANDREHTAQRSASARPAASGCARERCASRYLSCTKHSLSGALLLADNGFKATPYELRCANDREHTAQRSASARPAASGCARERCASRYLSCTKHSLSGASLLADNGFKATPYELRCANDREHTAQRSASARPAASGCARERCASRYLSCTKHSLSGASLLADNGFKATPYELRCANDREHTAQRSASARPAASGCARERCASRYLSCTKHSLSGASLLADNGFKATPYELRCANDREHTAQRSASARPAASGCARERCASRYLSCTKHSLSGASLLADNGFKATPYELRCANDREHTAQRSASARPAASGRQWL
ncbi:hypothetical protein ACJJTC_007583 [Scirpophaga incertulas]